MKVINALALITNAPAVTAFQAMTPPCLFKLTAAMLNIHAHVLFFNSWWSVKHVWI